MVLWLFVLGMTSAWAASTCEDVVKGDGPSMVQRLNERYDDFFRYHQQRAEREERLQRGVPDVHEARRRHEERLEQARRAHVTVPKDLALEERRRIEWEAMQKVRLAQLEEARKCLVQQRQAAEQVLLKGRKIPEMKEYDLEGY